MDETSTGGIYATEKVTFEPQNGTESAVEDFLIGCSFQFSSSEDFPGVDGLMGLSYGKHSLLAKMVPKYDYKFSYCLGNYFDVNHSSYFTFGDYKPQLLSPMRYTKFDVKDTIYYLNVKDVSVGGVMLATPPMLWNVSNGWGANLDTGATYPILPQQAYRPVMEQLVRALRGFRRMKSPLNMIDYCFDSSGFDESMVPRLAFHFVDGQKFEPPVRNYIMDTLGGVKCIAIMENRWSMDSPLGNFLQQNHFWEYDLKEMKLGFAPANCI